MKRDKILNAKRIIIKIGSSSLTHSSGKLNLKRLETLCDILSSAQKGREIIIVSSGAIAVGAASQGIKIRPKELQTKQALAAIGQTGLINIYEKFFQKHHQLIAQLLLTQEDFNDDIKNKNASNVLYSLLEKKVIPIINENDTISTKEIEFGDNDTLSALVAQLVKADLLIILSDVDGLFSTNPNFNSNAKIISQVNEITENIEKLASGKGSEFSNGGMRTKIEAAKICKQSNTAMIIANGNNPKLITEILEGKEIGTLFNFN